MPCHHPTAPGNLYPPLARHYNSDLSIWLSVDPMADKYPSTSPYTYCANNPVKLVDPNGEEMFDSEILDKWRYNETTGVLSWVSSEGGGYTQTIEVVANSSNGKTIKTDHYKYNGTITNAFKFCSVTTNLVGTLINGLLDVGTGIETIKIGLAVGVGGTVLSEGSLSSLTIPVGTAITAYGASQFINGLIQFGRCMEGNATTSIGQHNMIRDVLKSAANSSIGFFEDLPKFKFDKKFCRKFLSFGLPILWSKVQKYTYEHPTEYLGRPSNAISL